MSNRFLLWKHETLAKFARELMDEHLSLKEKAAKCTCGAVHAASSMQHETGGRAPIVQGEPPMLFRPND